MVFLALLLAAGPPARAVPPQQRARELARRLRPAYDAMLEIRRLAGGIGDPGLRAAVEAQLLTPWLPAEAFAATHGAAAEARLHAAHLLDGPLLLPPPRTGDFAAAPGGPCDGGGHHGYPGGLAVHALAAALHARALGQLYAHVYGARLDDDWLVAAAIWHDSLQAATLPFRDDGSCGPEPRIAGEPAHHVLGLAAALLRHLPPELVFAIASAHAAPTPENERRICGFIAAAGIVALGEPAPCPAPRRAEAFVTFFAEGDEPFTGTAWAAYGAAAPRGWERFEALVQDGTDVHWFQKREEAKGVR